MSGIRVKSLAQRNRSCSRAWSVPGERPIAASSSSKNWWIVLAVPFVSASCLSLLSPSIRLYSRCYADDYFSLRIYSVATASFSAMSEVAFLNSLATSRAKLFKPRPSRIDRSPCHSTKAAPFIIWRVNVNQKRFKKTFKTICYWHFIWHRYARNI